MEQQNATQIKNKVQVKIPKLYRVMMYNDDFTTMAFVIDVLIQLFNKNNQEAEKIMIDVHTKGHGTAGVYPYDLAMTKVGTAMEWAREEGFPFKLTLEEV